MKYKNYYKILELKGPGASEDEIKSSYRRLAKAYHPDINGGNKEVAEKFKDVNEAYQVLGDKSKKKRYNIRYRFHTLDNMDFESGMADFVGIFVGKDEKDYEEDKASVTEIIDYDEFVTLSISSEEVKNGVIKTFNYVLSNGKTKKLTIKVPAEAKNGTKIRLKGEGRIKENTNQKGDLYVIIDILDVDVNIKV